MAVGRNGVSVRDERERRVEGGGLEAGRHPPATPRPGPGVLQKVDYSGVNGGGGLGLKSVMRIVEGNRPPLWLVIWCRQRPLSNSVSCRQWMLDTLRSVSGVQGTEGKWKGLCWWLNFSGIWGVRSQESK